ncbi:hypothetical protein FSP39_010441 [Pinctada imbricata]|uniref:Uncharacterized protein n=1 Tax=Pinctada imbricata TaxID=66713 RepID=A0AA88YM33_PINIB|nr:hypothetical protein FSP39_010441 [Pinctada imbricata]
MTIYKAIKAEAMYLILQVQHKKMDSYRMKPTEDIKTAVWQVVNLLRNLNNEKHHYVDQLMSRHMIDYISTLNSICSDDLNMLHSRTHWLMWSFLITLGFFSLYGVLMIQAFSYRMELMMTTLTMFSISMLCYIVADLDSPFSGFFRIDIGIIADVLYRLEVMYKMASLGFEETVCYPDSSRFADRRRGKVSVSSEKV